MIVDPLAIADSFVIETTSFEDERGSFMEMFRSDQMREKTGHLFEPRQVNRSVSRRGVLRGIHFADIPSGQAKLVTVTRGAIIDFIVDIRVGSPTFGQWEAVELNAREHRSVYLAEGLGHAFLSLEDDSTVTYLVSQVFRPSHEHGVTPLDPSLDLALPPIIGTPLMSQKDRDAPTLRQAEESGLLPTWTDCLAWYQRPELAQGAAQ